MKASKLFAGKIKDRLSLKQDQTQRQPGVLGDANGVVVVPGLISFNYVMVGDKTLPIFNNRVPAQAGIKVWVGYEPDKNDKKYRNKLFQVLSTRSETPSGVETGYVGYAPARRYEWNATNGGQDPLTVHLRAFSPLRLGVSSAGGMNVELYKGTVHNGTDYLTIARQNIDLTAHIPSTTGKAALVMISIDNTGTVVETKGSEVDITALATTDRPAIPADTIFVCGCVRVYYGQTKVQEGRINTDFDDLRFPGLFATGGGGTGTVESVTGDGVDNTDPANPVLTFPTPAEIGAQVAGTYLTSANIENSITDGVTDKAPSENAVFDALALKLPLSVATDNYAPQGWDAAQVWSKAVVSVVTTKLRIVVSASANITYYWRGVKVNIGATSLTVNSTDDKAEGIWYCYSTDGANFILTQTPFYIFDYISGAIRADLMLWEFYWDNTNDVALWIQPEFHPSSFLSPSIHGYAHESFGTRYSLGLDISYGTTAANGDTRVKITDGEIHDEGISVYIEHSATPTAIWEQLLGSAGTADANYAALAIYYRSGADASNIWRKTTTSSYPFLPVSNNYIYYNRNNAGTWDYTTSISSSSWVVYWIVATSNQSEPVVVIPGRQDNANLTAAQSEAFPSLASLFSEYKLLYRIIYKTSASNSNNGKCQIVSVTDYRRDALANNASVSAAPSAAMVSFTAYGVVTATNVQAAIEQVVDKLIDYDQLHAEIG